MKWFPVCLLMTSTYLLGCGEHPSKIGVQREEASHEAVVAEPEGPLSPEDAYNSVCVTCHQADGQGTPNLYPPLAGSRWLNGNPEVPIRIVLHGLAGPIEVQGESYNSAMAAQLIPLRSSDANVAAAISYARTSWGNTAGAIEESAVTAVREDASITGIQTAEMLEPLLAVAAEVEVEEEVASPEGEEAVGEVPVESEEGEAAQEEE